MKLYYRNFRRKSRQLLTKHCNSGRNFLLLLRLSILFHNLRNVEQFVDCQFHILGMDCKGRRNADRIYDCSEIFLNSWSNTLHELAAAVLAVVRPENSVAVRQM
jgi:hypothetical protein